MKPHYRKIISIFLICVIISHVLATQYVASELGYQDLFLGEPLRIDAQTGTKLYWPWSIHVWGKMYWGGHIDEILKTGWMIIIGGVFAGIFGAIMLSPKDDGPSDAHGSSKWATDEEINQMDLIIDVPTRIKHANKYNKPINTTSCAVVGKTKKGKLFYDAGKEHTIVFAPTRSGKGVGYVIPTGFTWSGSIVFLDIKGENYQITSWWRSIFSHVIYFNPTSPASARFNPLFEIRKGNNVIRDTQNVSEILLNKPADTKSDPFWEEGGKDILTMAILHQLYKTNQKHLEGVLRFLFDVNMLETIESTTYENPAVDAFMADKANQLLYGTSENVCSGWFNTVRAAMNLWRDPLVAQATSTSDFRLMDMQYAKHPISLYIVIPPSDLKRLGPLVRVMLTQMTDVLTMQGVEDEDNKHRLLMLCDEFPQFGNMEKIHEAIGYTAGYGIKYTFIMQGIEQMRKNYGPNHSFIAGCHTKLAYSANDPINAKIVSELAGKTTVKKKQVTVSKVNNRVKGKSEVEVEVARDLITVGEAQQIPADSLVLFQAGHNPIKAKKVTYYDDPRFIPKFKGKKVAFPTEPLRDFPNARATHDWGESEAFVAQITEELMYRASPEYIRGTNEPSVEPEHPYNPSPICKESAQHAEDISPQILADEPPQEALRRFSTASISIQDIERVRIEQQIAQESIEPQPLPSIPEVSQVPEVPEISDEEHAFEIPEIPAFEAPEIPELSDEDEQLMTVQISQTQLQAALEEDTGKKTDKGHKP